MALLPLYKLLNLSFCLVAAKHDQILHFWVLVFFIPSCCFPLWCDPFFFWGLYKTLGEVSVWKDGTTFSYWVPASYVKLWSSTPAVLEWTEFLPYSIHLDVRELPRDPIPYQIYPMHSSVRLLHCPKLLNSENTTQETNRPTCKPDAKPFGALLIHISIASSTRRKERKEAQMGT